MVAFSVSDLPASVNTVEALAVWASTVLNNLHFQQEIQEAPGIIEKVAVSQCFPIQVNGAYEWRHVGRVSVKINSNFQYSGKLWNHVVPLSNASIPQDFKAA
jgi:hypothetical protein